MCKRRCVIRQYVCSCGWVCRDPGVIDYHQAKTCGLMRLMVNTIARREQEGTQDHDGLQIGRLGIVCAS